MLHRPPAENQLERRRHHRDLDGIGGAHVHARFRDHGLDDRPRITLQISARIELFHVKRSLLVQQYLGLAPAFDCIRRRCFHGSSLWPASEKPKLSAAQANLASAVPHRTAARLRSSSCLGPLPTESANLLAFAARPMTIRE